MGLADACAGCSAAWRVPLPLGLRWFSRHHRSPGQIEEALRESTRRIRPESGSAREVALDPHWPLAVARLQASGVARLSVIERNASGQSGHRQYKGVSKIPLVQRTRLGSPGDFRGL